MLDKAVEVLQLTVKPDRKTIGMTFKKDQKAVCSALEGLDSDKAAEVEKAHSAGQPYELDGFSIAPGMVLFTRKKKMVQVVKFTPSVIEPSSPGDFTALLSTRSLSERKMRARRLPVRSAAADRAASTQSGSKFHRSHEVVDLLTQAGISTKADTSGQVSRRYAAAELECPLGDC